MPVAIKKLARPFQIPEIAKRAFRELTILHHMDHENIACLIDTFTPNTELSDFSDVYLVMPLMTCDLDSLTPMDDEQVQFIIYQILRALKYIHSAGIIHRDLKPKNITINEDLQLRIIDFGLARKGNDDLTEYVVTRWYRAPEVILKHVHYNDRVDIWSVGCIMAELFLRTPLFPGNDDMDQLRSIFRVTGPMDDIFLDKMTSDIARSYIIKLVPEYITRDFQSFFADNISSPDAIDLLDKMLELDPDRRISAEDALAHPYLAEYYDPSDEPNAEIFQDYRDNFCEMTVEKWKELIWDFMKNKFAPRVTNIPDSSSRT